MKMTMKHKGIMWCGLACGAMKSKLLAIAVLAISVASLNAQYTTNTLSFSGASWSDGGSLDGYFTIQYQAGTPEAVLSLDVSTGNGTSDGFIGFDYIYNVSGQADTVIGASFSNSSGTPAYELVTTSLDSPYNRLYLDWQGSTPTSLYVGDIGGQYSSENYTGAPGIRSLNNEGGSLGSAPEPSTLALLGFGSIALLGWQRHRPRREA
jgi:hypothetical protein